MVGKDFFSDVGLLDETYFLYFEEVSTAARARKQGYSSVYAIKSKVYHKGAHTVSAMKSGRDYFFHRSKAIFMMREYPNYFPMLVYKTFEKMLNNVLKGRFKEAGEMFKGFRDGIRDYK
jgi:GT2 family glycosyltransferase